MGKPLIYITRKLPNNLLKPYEETFDFKMWEEEKKPVPREQLLQEAEKADGILCLLTDQIDKTLLKKAAHLKIVANLAVGYDNIDVTAANKHQVIITNTPDVLTETTADLTFALLMATARKLIQANEFIKNDLWEDWTPFELVGFDVYQKTIGIVGMGRIGEAVARRAKGFNMNILYHNRSRKIEFEQEIGAKYVEFDSLLEQADYVVCLAPLTEETKEMFDESAFKKMKQTAIFINVSRGLTVDENALCNALQSGEIHAAGLDVFVEEPMRKTHPLLQLDNVVCLPHIGSASLQTRENMVKLCLENLKHYFSDGKAKTPVN